MELKNLAENGSIVVFNVSQIRSDAFLVSASGIRSLQLPLLTFEDLLTFTDCFLTAIDTLTAQNYSDAKRKVHTVLEWLWDVAVCPVLDELGFSQTPTRESWPRVWWIGCGLLNILPIHAAGYHESASNPPLCAIDRVISSYAPTVKSLAYARERVTRVAGVTVSFIQA